MNGRPCHYCGAAAVEVDHIVPRAKGGTNGLYNLVPACETCNDAKADSVDSEHCRKCRRAVRMFETRKQADDRWDVLSYADWTNRTA